MTALLNENQTLSLELIQVDLLVTAGTTRRWVRFTGESPKWLDSRICSYLEQNPHLSVDLDSPGLCFQSLPHTVEMALNR
ncbi:hypothetical protein [Kocuria palustris]|uniref:hypothetical protein n=1 Tax=Kocuria palustris TaxID=71999 RepID=UPI0028D78810|nr:hypothetical protein [Kocuria palustris]